MPLTLPHGRPIAVPERTGGSRADFGYAPGGRRTAARHPACARPAPPSRSRGARPATAGIHAGATSLTFDTLGLSADLLQTVADEGYVTPDARPGRGHPARARRDATSWPPPRPGPARRPPSRCRSSIGCAAQANTSFSPARHPVRALILVPDPRARDAGRRERPDLRADRAAAVDGGLRRHPDGSTDQGAARRRRDPDRDARAPARSRRPEGREPRPGRDPRPRRGGPDARHGLPARHPADHRAAAEATPEPDVLGDLLGRHPAAVRDDPAGPRDRRGRAAQHRPSRASASSSTRSTATARKSCWPTSSAPATCTRCWSSRGRSSPRRGWRRASTGEGLEAVAIHSDRSQPERTRALEGFKTGDIRVLVATDVAARGLDIEDLPVVVNFELPWNPQDYIHRIGRTGRAGADRRGDQPRLHRRGRPAARHPADAQARRSRGRSRTGFVPDRSVEPRPLGMRSGHAHVGREHHAHRKPVRRRSGAGAGSGGSGRRSRGRR